MSYLVYGIVYIKDPFLLIARVAHQQVSSLTLLMVPYHMSNAI